MRRFCHSQYQFMFDLGSPLPFQVLSCGIRTPLHLDFKMERPQNCSPSLGYPPLNKSSFINDYILSIILDFTFLLTLFKLIEPGFLSLIKCCAQFSTYTELAICSTKHHSNTFHVQNGLSKAFQP